jgi:hypothetical protein
MATRAAPTDGRLVWVALHEVPLALRQRAAEYAQTHYSRGGTESLRIAMAAVRPSREAGCWVDVGDRARLLAGRYPRGRRG